VTSDRAIQLAADSRDHNLTLRRLRRQHRMIELLGLRHAGSGAIRRPVPD